MCIERFSVRLRAVLSPPLSLHINPHCVWLIINATCTSCLSVYLHCIFYLYFPSGEEELFPPQLIWITLEDKFNKPLNKLPVFGVFIWTPTRTSRSLRCMVTSPDKKEGQSRHPGRHWAHRLGRHISGCGLPCGHLTQPSRVRYTVRQFIKFYPSLK